MKNKLDEIRQNNLNINALIQEIINSSSEEAFKTNENGNHEITDTYRKVIELEIEKIFRTYHLEFPNLSYEKNRKLNICVYNGSHIDGCYNNNSLKYSYGIKTGFEKLKQGKIDGESIGYNINKDGKVTYDKDGLTKKISTNLVSKDDGKPFMITQDELIENDLNNMSNLLYYYLNDSKYEDELFNIMPHELTHAFGFGSGLFEGLTESLSREVSAKYGLRNFPCARKELVVFMQKIERTIGRDKLVENSHIFNGNEERTDIISDLIDDKLQVDEKNLFKNLCDTFKENEIYNNNLEKELLQKLKAGNITIEQCQTIFEKDENIKKYKELEGNYFNKLDTSLDEYINKNPNSLYPLGTTNIKGKSSDFEDVISFQENEINSLNEIIEEIKERNTLSNNNFKSSLQGMLKEVPLSEDLSKDEINFPKDKTIKKEDINL